jgi:undecaprenyl-diphosphatase
MWKTGYRGGRSRGARTIPPVRRAAAWLAAAAALLLALVLTAAGVGEEPGGLANWQALALGLVQGLTELLPISSSGHLALTPWLLEWEFLTENRAFAHTFDVGLHLGTLVAVAAYFWREVVTLPQAWVRSALRRRVETADERLAWLVFVATLPAVAIGGIGGTFIAERLGEPWQVASLLALFALVLFAADRKPRRRQVGDLGLGSALAVGLAQTLALAPGVSRSGVTISAGRFLGLERAAAARFSFLLLIPVTFGAVVYKGVTDVLLGELPPGVWGPFAVGLIAAAVSGLAAIWGLFSYVRRHDYTPFVVYRLLAAAAVLTLILAGIRPATF